MEWKDSSVEKPDTDRCVMIWVEWDDSPIVGWYSNGSWYEHTEWCTVQGDAYLDRSIATYGARLFWKEIPPYPFPKIEY